MHTLTLITFLQAVGQLPVADVRPEWKLSSQQDVTLSIGASYRPIGESAELQRQVAQQLEQGWAAEVLGQVTEKEGYRVSVDARPDGAIAVQVRVFQATRVDPQDFLDGNYDEMARSLRVEDHAFARQVDELAGPEAATLVRAAFLVSGRDEDLERFADVATVMANDPEVRAMATVLVANSVDLQTALAASVDHRTTGAVAGVHAAAVMLAKDVATSASGINTDDIQQRARAAWSSAAGDHPEVNRRVRRVTAAVAARGAGWTNVAGERGRRALAGASGSARRTGDRAERAALAARDRTESVAILWGQRTREQARAWRAEEVGAVERSYKTTASQVHDGVGSGLNAAASWTQSTGSVARAYGEQAGTAGRERLSEAARQSAAQAQRVQEEVRTRAIAAQQEAAARAAAMQQEMQRRAADAQAAAARAGQATAERVRDAGQSIRDRGADLGSRMRGAFRRP